MNSILENEGPMIHAISLTNDIQTMVFDTHMLDSSTLNSKNQSIGIFSGVNVNSSEHDMASSGNDILYRYLLISFVLTSPLSD